MTKGKIIEQGSHEDLFDRRGAYWNLIEAQRIGSNDPRDEKADLLDDNDSEYHGTVITDEQSMTKVEPYDRDLAKPNRRNSIKSVSSMALKDKLPDKPKEYSLFTIVRFILSFNKQEWYFVLCGLF